MSFATSINAAISGLKVASRRAEVVSSNIAGAQTDGYARRSLATSTGAMGGVRIDGVVRSTDPAVIADRRLAEADLGAIDANARILQRLERLLGGIGEDGSLTSRVTDLEAALVSASADPASEVRQAVVVDRLKTVASTLNRAGDGIQSLRMEIEAGIGSQVDTLNDSLARVEALNAEIRRVDIAGVDTSNLLDQRQQAIDRIASIVPVREIDRGHGQVALMTPSGVMLVDGKRAEIGFEGATYITADMTLASGGLNGLTLNGAPLDDAARRLGGGTLAGAFALRDEILPGAQAALDASARDLLERFQDPAVDPTLGPTDPGLFTDAGALFDPADTAGLASRIAVNAAIDPGAGGATWRIRDGVMAAAEGTEGDPAQINRWLDAMADRRATYLGGNSSSAAGHLAELMSDIGAQRLSADTNLAYQSARFETLKQAELANGVDTDVELQNLLQIEQAYAANAKVLQSIDTMMSRLLEL